MGPSENKEVIHAVSQDTNSPMDKGVPANKSTETTRRRRTRAVNQDKCSNKTKRKHDEINTLDLDSENDLESSLTSFSSIVSSNVNDNVNSKDNHINNNNNISSRRPPIVVTLKDKHNVLHIKALVNKVCNHTTTVCKLKEDAIKFKCVNCSGDHKANSIDCPTFIKYTARVAKSKGTQLLNIDSKQHHHYPSVVGTSKLRNTFSYAAVARNNNALESQNQQPICVGNNIQAYSLESD
ncbi:hypothetical protein PV326_013471 [Microctonus aethiopoides]|nr:hypothetical protein PV326_013471 [Microctonus aethiopoides]